MEGGSRWSGARCTIASRRPCFGILQSCAWQSAQGQQQAAVLRGWFAIQRRANGLAEGDADAVCHSLSVESQGCERRRTTGIRTLSTMIYDEEVEEEETPERH